MTKSTPRDAALAVLKQMYEYYDYEAPAAVKTLAKAA